MKSKLVIILFIALFFINLFAFNAYHNTINWDKAGYYLYLPAIFINHDLANLAFYEHVDAEYQPTGDVKRYSISQDSVTKRRLNKYPAGVAVLELPFFLLAKLYTDCTGYPALYGYSEPYQISVCIATIFWLVLGLFYLRKLLLRYFNDGVVAAALALLLFGTNLWCYSIFDMGMSHPFSFGLYCLLLYCTDEWYRTKSGRHIVVAGALLGLIAIVRPTNAIAILIPLCWYNKEINTIGRKWKFFISQYRYVLTGCLFSVAILMLQFAYWHYITGHWIIYSYKGETFDFTHPHILDGLTSYNKGWLVYTPMALFCIAGFVPFWKHNRQLCIAILLFAVLNIYIVFSWSFWPYGGGFSARALIESYALLAFPLAALIQWLSLRKQATRVVFCIVFASFIVLNIFQTWQVHNRILPSIWINEKEYWNDFGKIKAD
ncbi:MAG: hypothetical protein P4L41_15755 [Flavipsychrobacter sp.]|nr:hypothetical protein [Flavipsychrobacter sp.]